MTIRAVVTALLIATAEQQHRPLAPLTDDLELLDSGLDSICIAMLVASLEDELDLDPFGSGDVIEVPTTFGELVRIYEHASEAD